MRGHGVPARHEYYKNPGHAHWHIEHLDNDSWEGADHYYNYSLLHYKFNLSPEFTEGPGHVKRAAIGTDNFRFVRAFGKWQKREHKPGQPFYDKRASSNFKNYLAKGHHPRPGDHAVELAGGTGAEIITFI